MLFLFIKVHGFVYNLYLGFQKINLVGIFNSHFHGLICQIYFRNQLLFSKLNNDINYTYYEASRRLFHIK